MSLPESVVAPAFSQDNPFKGLAYYEEDDAPRFAGRQREVEAVANGILRTRTFVIYGRSGLGKTSVLLAGVLPRLTEQGCRTVYVRVLEDPLADLRQALLKPSGLETQEAGDLASADLRTLLERVGAAKDQERPVVLVFDQFEEFFVRFADQPDPAGGVRRGEELDRDVRQQRIAQREAFVQEMGRLASDVTLNLRLLFSLREDWIAEMRDFAPVIPEITRYMLRLLPLTSFGVRQAIVETLRSAETTFDHSLISALVDALAEVQFDPAVLQVLGSEVWEKARARCQEGEPVRLELADFQAVRGVRDIFRSYLDQVHRQIKAANLRQKIQTRAILVAMISEKRTKLAMSDDFLLQQQDFDVTADELKVVLATLVEHRLVRPDPSGRWFELVHERLIAEILEWLDTDLDYFKFRSARNLVANSCRNPGWRDNPELLLNRGQLDDAVGPFKELLRFSEEERFFLVSSAIYAHSRDLEYWAELVGFEASADLIDRFLGQQDHERLRCRAAEAAARVKERSGHFAERCLDLALHDPSEPVRQAAARSFASLATGPELENLSTRLGEKKSRKAALDVLTDVVDQGKMASAGKIARFDLWKAWRKLYKRRFEAAWPIVQQRSLRGALTGLWAALLWGLTVGALLLRIFFYEILPEVGVVKSWAWPVSVGLYLLLALPLGMGAGWWVARQLAKQALRRGREGLLFQALAGISASCGAVFLITMFIPLVNNTLTAGTERTTDFVSGNPFLLICGGAASLLGVALMVAIGGGLASPAFWPDRPRSAWLWSWIWAFGGSLFVPSVLWLVIPWGFNAREALLINIWNIYALLFLAASALIGGLVLYISLLALRLPDDSPFGVHLVSLQNLSLLWIRRSSRILGASLAATVIALLALAFGLDGLPFGATSVTIAGKDIELPLRRGVGMVGTDHFELRAPKPREQGVEAALAAPRLARLSATLPARVISSELNELLVGHKGLEEPVLVLQAGEALHVAIQRKTQNPGAIRIQLDHPIDAPWSPREVSRLAVARFSSQDGVWYSHLSGLRSPGKQPLFVAAGAVQGGAWCEGELGFDLQLRGGVLNTWMSDLRCSRRPKLLHFSPAIELRTTPGVDPELTFRAWRPVVLEPDRKITDGSFNPDGTTLTLFSKLSEVLSVASWSMNHLQGAPESLVNLPHPKPVKNIDFSPGRAWLVTTTEDAVTRLWRVNGTHIDGSRSVSLPGTLFLFSKDATRLATYAAGSIRVWKVQRSVDPALVNEISGVGDLGLWSFNSGGSQLFFAGTDGVLRLWNVESKAKPLLLRCLTEATGDWDTDVRFAPTGATVEKAYQNGTMCIWQIDNSGHLLRTLRREVRPATDLTRMARALTKAGVLPAGTKARPLVWFSPDGSRVLTITDGIAQIGNADGSGEPTILEDGISTASFSADGTRLVTHSVFDDGIRIWKTDSLNSPEILDHASKFTTNGIRVVTISGSVVRIWDINHPQEPIVLVHNEDVEIVKFSQDGNYALTILTTGGVRVWNLAQPYRPKNAGDLFLLLRVSRKAGIERKAPEKLMDVRSGGPR